MSFNCNFYPIFTVYKYKQQLKLSKMKTQETVTHARFGAGTVISRENGNVTVDFNEVGEKTLIERFAKLDVEFDPSIEGGIKERKMAKKSKGQKRRERASRELAMFNTQSNLQKLKSQIMWINGSQFGDKNSVTVQNISELFSMIKIEANESEFALSIIKTIYKTYRASEKQAYCVAKLADDLGIKFQD